MLPVRTHSMEAQRCEQSMELKRASDPGLRIRWRSIDDRDLP